MSDFEPRQSRIPTTIGQIKITLFDPTGEVGNRDAEYKVQVIDQNGRGMTPSNGKLLPKLTTDEKAGLNTLLDSLRLRAEAQIITGP